MNRKYYLPLMVIFRASIFIVSIIATNTVFGQPKTDPLFAAVFSLNHNNVFQHVLRNKDTYRCQVIYTQINRDKNNVPHFRNYYYNYDPNLYFNPASMVKLPLAFLSLEKLNSINIKGVDKYATIQYDSSYTGQKPLYKDSTSANGFPSIAHFIKRAFLISENDPYNRMYQFVGQQQINQSLHNKGYSDVRITRQFMGFTEEQNRHTNAVRVLDANGKTLYAQAAAYNTDSFDFSHQIKIGKGYLNRNDSLIKEPFDFTKHNNISLYEFQQILQSFLFPASVPAKQRFNLTKDDREFLLKYLSQYPSETNYPKYDTATFYDSYVKFYFYDSTHNMPSNVRIFNKVGWAYGFLTDVSYIIDTKSNIEFMLSSTIYANNDEILNDDKYDFESTGHPFMYQLGQTFYNYELHLKRTYKPDLSAFKLKYDHRDCADKRPSIKIADN